MTAEQTGRENQMSNGQQTRGQSKPFLRGTPTDENTVQQALKFFGAMILVAFMSFIVCSMTSFSNNILRIGINIVIETLIILIFFNKGADMGTEGVSRGEILFQHIQKGQEASQSEKRIPFHPAKGFVIGLLGSSLFMILALLLALTAERQMTGAGTLPTWMESYMRRSEISDALAGYSQSAAVSATDIFRIIIRLTIMPFVSICGAENRDLLLTVERLSPALVLIPAAAYGTGYMQGPSRRRKIHTEIAENARRRRIREKRERRARITVPKGPQQLN